MCVTVSIYSFNMAHLPLLFSTTSLPPTLASFTPVRWDEVFLCTDCFGTHHLGNLYVTRSVSLSGITDPPAASALVPREARVVPPNYAVESWKRASPQAPNGYAPSQVNCPSTRPSIRSADTISSEETEWLKKRRPNTIEPMRQFLERVNIQGFNAGQYIDKHRSNTTALPNIAISFSGGGYRALLNGAGAMSAFDSRTSNSTSAGHLGGLLQASTYVSALSGGGWMLGSIYANNFTTVESILNQGGDSAIWQFQNNLFKGPPDTGIKLVSIAQYYENLISTVKSKADATAGDFNTSITDVYGRGLSFQLINASDGAPGMSISIHLDNTN